MTLRSVPTEALATWRPCHGGSDLARAAVFARHYRRARWTALEVLCLDEVSPADRLWLVLREAFLTARVLRLCAAAFAERALLRERAAGREPDPRSWCAVEVARQHAAGQLTDAELDAAWGAAWGATNTAAWCATATEAWSAAKAAAWAAAEAATWAAARAATCAAATELASGDAAWAAAEASAQCAFDAERRAQCGIVLRIALDELAP